MSPYRPSVLRRLDDAQEFARLDRGAADQEAVDVLHAFELAAVVPIDASTVDDPEVFGDLRRDLGREQLSDVGVGVLRLLRGGNDAGPDGPGRTKATKRQ